MANSMFRKLTPEEKLEFIQWARENYVVGTPINSVWHPVIRQECERMNVAAIESRKDGARPIYKIAQDIEFNWRNVNPTARPYLEAMKELETTDDSYFQDSALDIISRFLANARTWKGEKAREIKEELKNLIP